MQRDIVRRLKELEQRAGSNLPDVIAEYQDGSRVLYKGLPPIEDIFSENNPIIRTAGSEFADLVNSILHPVPNRNIEELEEMQI